MYADVLIEYNVKSLDRTFTYRIPSNMIVKVGNKVKVKFGDKTIYGIVLNIKNSTEIDNISDIIEVINSEIYLNSELLELGKYMSEITYSTLIKSYQTMLPTSLKVKRINTNYEKNDEYLILNKDRTIIEEYLLNNKRKKAQVDILNRLLNNERLNKKDVSSTYKTLLDLGLIKIEKERKYRLINDRASKKEYVLTSEQESIVKSIDLNRNDTYLLHGVTGSGKTIIYIDLIKQVIKDNKTAILLVPEISLTTQMVNRLYDSFSNDVAILHSELSDGEKFDEYTKIIKGEVHVVVGTRSSVFAPLNNIGIIIIDEEHSTSYKQETTPRYNAIDIAKYRCKYHDCPLILGSATPSLESYARCVKGVYKLLTLDKRIGNYKMPEISLVDMSIEAKKRNMIFSDLLKEEIKLSLDRNEQVMILLNRRGYSTIVNCQNCGFTYKCPHCEITLTYHKSSNNLRCHYCGYTTFLQSTCPKCKEDSIRSFGLGTEKVENELHLLFPDKRILRMDRDTTTRKGSHSKYIKLIENNEVDIIVGTQMISKGLDFPNISLVGIINGDESFYIPDFRSNERTFGLLNQVSGRAGRSGINSKVIIQTYNPDNIIYSFIKNNDYISFYNYEMDIRHKLKYPPYYYLLSIKVCSKDYELASKNSIKVCNYLKNNISDDTIILGPSTASIFKLNNIYRFQIIIKYKKLDNIKEHIRFIDNMYINEKNVYLEIDNNPLTI